MRNPVTPSTAARVRRMAGRTALPALVGLTLITVACATAGRQAGPWVAPPRAPLAAAPAASTPAAGYVATPGDLPASTPSTPAASAPSQYAASPELTVRVRITDASGTRVITLPLDEYVLGCVRAELSPRITDSQVLSRILQVQAIVSRTYAIANLHRHGPEGFDLCDGTHCQLYRAATRSEHAGDPAARAVAETSGQVLTFGGRAIQAVFHSNCGGHTAAAEQVWSGPAVPYLRPVPDWFCSRTTEAHWEFAASEQQLRRALNADTRTAMGARVDRLDITERDAAGRATLITVAGERSPVVRAEDFRTVMRRAFGPRSIQSTWFTVTRQANMFRFTGVGYGHGVGMCQAGAALRAQAGQTPSTILAHYFPGSRVDPVSTLAALPGRAVTGAPAQ